jgi:membrane protein YfhO
MASWGSGHRGTLRSRAAAHPHLAAAGLFALVVFAYLWPALVGGKVLSSVSVITKLPPWQPYRPADVASFENYLLADVPLAIQPWRVLVRQLLHAGTLPAWNPHVLTGVALYTNPQSGLFTPFNLPLWVLPLNSGLTWSAALKLWAGGFGGYLLVRELRLGFLPGLLAGVAFTFSALNILWLLPETLPGVAVMLPWMLWLVERAFLRPTLGVGLGLALVTAVALGGGHPGTQVHVLAAAGLYALMRAALLRDAPLRERLRPLALSGGGLALGVLVMSAMLIPEALSSRGTMGTIARSSESSTLPGLRHMPFAMARTVLFPDWWGRPSAFETSGSPLHTMNLNYGERTFYAGVVTVLLACVGLVWRGAWRRSLPFAVLGVLGLAIAIHVPGLFQLVEALPVIGVVQNQRLHFVFELAAAVLAAFGCQALLERPRGERLRLAVPLLAVLAGAIAWGTAGASLADVGRTARHFLTGRDFPIAGVVALTSVWWLLLLAAGVGAALLALRRWPGRRVPIAAGLVLLTAFDMLHFAHGYNPMGPASKVFPPRPPAVAYLQRHERDGRIAGIELDLLPDFSGNYGLNDVRGYDTPYPTLRYFRLWREGTPDQAPWRPMMIDALTPASTRVLELLGARYVLGSPGATTLAPAGARPLPGTRRVYAGPDATIFSLPASAPRALVPARVRVVGGERAARAAVMEAGFDPRRDVVLERGDAGAAAIAAAPPARGTVALARERDASVALRATLDRRGLVVLNDELTAGWSARVDGRPAPVLHVNDVMRGVVVPAGRHDVTWRYAVPGLRAGIALSVLGLALLASGGVAIGTMGRTRIRRRVAVVARTT